MDFEEEFDGDIVDDHDNPESPGNHHNKQLSTMNSIAINHIPICDLYLFTACVFVSLCISLSLQLPNAPAAVIRERRWTSPSNRQLTGRAGDAPMDRLADPFGSTLDLNGMREESAVWWTLHHISSPRHTSVTSQLVLWKWFRGKRWALLMSRIGIYV